MPPSSVPSSITSEAFDIAVIGAGAAGIAAARYARDRGRRVVLIEKEERVGGHAAGYGCKAVGSCVKCSACVAARAAGDDDGIAVLTGRTASAVSGAPGAFRLETGPDSFTAGRILVTAGFSPYDAARKGRFGMGRVPGVVTGTEADRMLAAGGRLASPVTGKPSRNTAFIQCVGSRDRTEGHDWCSRVCCAYALRMASMAVTVPDARATVFYMDIQNFGKDSGALRSSLVSSGAVSFVRCIPGRIDEGADGLPVLAYEGPGGMMTASFDLVVLSVGIMPRDSTRELADVLGIGTEESGFLTSRSLREPLRSTRDGIFIAGTCREPMTIADAVAEGEAAAALACADGGCV